MGLLYLGIDPGFTGGLAIIDSKDKILEVVNLPITLIPTGEKVVRNFKIVDKTRKRIDGIGLTYILKPYATKGGLVCMVEHSQAMGTEGSVSLFNYGEGYGKVLGVLEALGIPYNEVHPTTWKNKMKIHGDKYLSISRCHELFPESRKTIRLRKHDGMAEALLLAKYSKDYTR